MKTVWHKGPPPEIGWWPASRYKDNSIIRWWNGKWWSDWAVHTCSAKDAAHYATIKDILQEKIRWTERWWLT